MISQSSVYFKTRKSNLAFLLSILSFIAWFWQTEYYGLKKGKNVYLTVLLRHAILLLQTKKEK